MIPQHEELAAMARDPDIQREIRDIEVEFSVTEEDGFEFASKDLATTRTADGPAT